MGKLLPMALIATIFFSCTTGSSYNRGSLSDAMEKSRDDNPGKREVPNKREKKPSPWENDDDSTWQDDANAPSRGNTAPTGTDSAGSEFTGPLYVLVRGGNSWYSEPYFDPVLDAELLVGFRADRIEGFLFGGFKGVTVKETSPIAESIDENVLFLRAGVEVRFYPLPRFSFFAPYLLAQFGGIYMTWDFKNPLTAGPEVITDDALGGMVLAAGIGANVIDTKSFRLGVSCIPEIHVFSAETDQGFQNDVFDCYSTIRWAVDAGFAFK